MKIKGRRQHDVLDKVIAFAASAGLNDEQLQLLQTLRANGGHPRIDMANAVFESLFRNKSYALSLYRSLAPDDDAVTQAEIELENPPVGSIRGFRSTLRFWVRNELQLVVEARSALSPRMECDLIRFVAAVWDCSLVSNNRFASATHPAQIPPTKIYILFPFSSETERENGVRMLGDVSEGSLTCSVEYVYGAPTGSFLDQLMRSMKVCDDVVKRCQDNDTALVMIRERCTEENLIPDYFSALSPQILLGLEPAPDV